MKPFSKFILLAATTMVAFAPSLTAQIETFQSQTGYAGNTETFASLANKTQVFTDVLDVTNLTYNFFAGSGGGGVTTGTTLSAKFGEWNGTSINLGTAIDLGQFTIGASGTGASPNIGWSNTLSYTDNQNQTVVTGSFLNASYTFDFRLINGLDPVLGFAADPTKSYALTLSYVSGDQNLALGANTNSTSFVNGYQYPYNPEVFPPGFQNYDYVFSTISVVPNPTIPESSTVASVLAAIMVAGLVAFRIRQQRRQQLVLAPVSVA